MSPDRLRPTERSSKSGPRIYSPEAFDRLIGEQPSLRDTIAGFSTVSVSHVIGKLTQPEFSISTWSNDSTSPKRVNVALNEPLQRKVFQREPDEESTFPHFMYENRAYAPTWTMGEIYHEIEPTKSFDDTQMFLEPVMAFSPLLIEATERQTIRTFEELIDATVFPQPNDTGMNTSYIGSLEMLFRLGFSRPENFFRFLNEIPQRKGVQIIYGPTNQFAHFLEQAENNSAIISVGDEYEGVSIFSPIPGDLVMGIIPLGNYEKRVLLGEK